MNDAHMSQKEVLIKYVDNLVSTWNLAVLLDGTNVLDK